MKKIKAFIIGVMLMFASLAAYAEPTPVVVDSNVWLVYVGERAILLCMPTAARDGVFMACQPINMERFLATATTCKAGATRSSQTLECDLINVSK